MQGEMNSCINSWRDVAGPWMPTTDSRIHISWRIYSSSFIIQDYVYPFVAHPFPYSIVFAFSSFILRLCTIRQGPFTPPVYNNNSNNNNNNNNSNNNKRVDWLEKESQKPSVINPPRSVITHTPAAHILLSDTLFLFERKREEVEEDIVGQFRFPSLSLLLRLSKRWGLNASIRTAARAVNVISLNYNSQDFSLLPPVKRDMDSCRHWSSAVSYIRVYVYIVRMCTMSDWTILNGVGKSHCALPSFWIFFFLLFVGSVVCVCNKEAMKKKKKKFFTQYHNIHISKKGGKKNIFRADRFTMQPAVFSFLLVFVLTGHITHTNTQREKAKWK
jgi:hypothetical protein